MRFVNCAMLNLMQKYENYPDPTDANNTQVIFK